MIEIELSLLKVFKGGRGLLRILRSMTNALALTASSTSVLQARRGLPCETARSFSSEPLKDSISGLLCPQENAINTVLASFSEQLLFGLLGKEQ